MKAIQPLEINTANLISSNIPLTDHPAWSAATAYVVGDKVIREEWRYECAVDNTNKDPDVVINIYDPDTETGYWTLLGAANRYKMFDSKSSSQTIGTGGTIEASFVPGDSFTAFHFDNVVANELQVTVKKPDTTIIFDDVVNLVDYSDITDFWSWFFVYPEKLTSYTNTNVPNYAGATVEVTVTNSAGDAACGEFSIGRVVDLFTTYFDSTVGLSSSINTTTNDVGEESLEKRYVASRISYVGTIDNKDILRTKNFLKTYQSQGIVYLGDNDVPDFEYLNIFGVVQDFNIRTALNRSNVTLTIEEVI